jgi:tRNA-dihydrouridine synthase B
MQKGFSRGFWNTIEGPIVGLSPMDGVTDAPMRFVAKKYGQPDVVYTEFVSAEGLWRIKKRGEMEHKIWKDLKYDSSERPVIAQIFGSDPESFYVAAKIICELGFDGLDINMGCPSPGLEKRGGGAGLIRDKCNAEEVIAATRRGVKEYAKENNKEEIPVTLKTRIGSAKPDEAWWKLIASKEMPAVAMHGRTFKQLYSGEADWEELFKAGEIIRESGALFLGNGDVKKIKNVKNQNNEVSLVVETNVGREINLAGKMETTFH